MNNDFMLYGRSKGVSGLLLQDYISKCYQNPMILEPNKSFTSPIDIFSRLMKDRIIFIGNVIDFEVANIVNAQLLYLDYLGKLDITIYINSPGGSIIDGLGIYDTMQFIPAKIKTVCIGMAASMASILLCAGSKGERHILPNSRVLIHQPSGGTYGTAADMTIDVNEINKDKEVLYNILSKHTGNPVEKIVEDADRDFWMNAEEAKAYGCVDKIIQYANK